MFDSLIKSMSTRRFGLHLFGILLALAATASAQTVPFAMVYQSGGTATTITSGSSLTFVSSPGQVQTLQVRATYTGSGRATISQNPTVIGTSTLTATIDQTLPVRLDPDQAFTFTIRYSPATSSPSTGQLSLPFSESPVPDAGAAPPITLNLQGLASSLALSYVLPADQNVVPIGDNATIPFPDTLVGGTASAGLNITNLGSGPGQVTGIDITGAAFKLQNKPFLPASLAANATLGVQIVYRPTAQQADTGTVTISIAGSTPVTVRLSGHGVLSQLSYQALNPDTSLTPGDTIAIPAIEPGQTSTRLVRISNSGSAPATISQLNVSGTGFALAAPVTLPITVQPSSSTTINIAFTPTRGGAATGTLLVNADAFPLSGSGLAAQLTYSYVVGGTVVTLGNGAAIAFSPVQLTGSSTLNVTVKNSGTSPTVVASAVITTANSPFSVPQVSGLPATIQPNASLNIPVRFEPAAVGASTAVLAIDGANFNVTGVGTQPPALPSYTITSPTGTTSPFTQPIVSLKLASPYPATVTGTLTLAAATGALPSDPAVQFATGGRTVNFRIPANSTSAIFGTSTSPLGTEIGLQTGSVAGTFTLIPTFATLTNIDLTPQTPTTSQFSVAAAAPTVLNVRVTGATDTTLTIEVTGYTTTRSLTALTISFKTAPKFTMPTSSFTFNLTGTSAGWFQSTASQAFGGQFRVSVPFAFQLPAGQSILTGLTAVSATVSNATGTSAQVAETQLQ